MSYRHRAAELDLPQGERERHRRRRDQHRDPESVHVGQGGRLRLRMGVSEDEASWVVTTYLVANAIILTANSFLARMLGRKTFFLICLGLFTLSSLLSGFAPNLNALLLFRILQGVGGGGMVP